MAKSDLSKDIQEIKRLLSEQSHKPLNFDEAATYLNLTKSTLYKLTSIGKISYFKPGGKKIFFEKSYLDKWILRNPVYSDDEIEEQANKYMNSKIEPGKR